MSISRRKFIKIGGVSSALIAGNCLGLDKLVFAQTRQSLFTEKLSAEVYGDILMSYHIEDFRKLIGSNFSFFAEGFAETAVLIEVEDNKASGGKSKKKNVIESAEDFMLSFRVSKPEVEQATYTVIQSNLGQFDLLLVPARNAKGETLLNAVINRL